MIDPIQHAHGLGALMTPVSIGCLSALLLHQVLMYFEFRDKSFLLFTGLASATCLATLIANDFTKLSWWLQGSRWEQSALPAMVCLGAVVNLIFSRVFLNTRQLVAKIDAAMRLLVGVLTILIFLLVLSVYFLSVCHRSVHTRRSDGGLLFFVGAVFGLTGDFCVSLQASWLVVGAVFKFLCCTVKSSV